MVIKDYFLNFEEFIIQIISTDCINLSYSFITFRNLRAQVVKAVTKHFDRTPFVAVGQNLQVELK
jgi:hypothetical protein